MAEEFVTKVQIRMSPSNSYPRAISRGVVGSSASSSASASHGNRAALDEWINAGSSVQDRPADRLDALGVGGGAGSSEDKQVSGHKTEVTWTGESL